MSVRVSVLAQLRTAPYLTVHDGTVPVDDADAKVVTSALPYVVYFGTLPLPESEDLCGSVTKRTPSFQVTYVGATPEQAEAAGERAQSVLDFQFITVDGQLVQVIPTDAMWLDRDDNHVRPGGGELFHGVLRYDIHIPT